ncbi:tetratricopeptide repeat protein [Litoribrevibacter euphylliae]|uniref:Tetratricopeptide repeat protein n=1 Tax=Litoribrevibacter euphylliae TaxID=1834034 RepID=A0ABV7HEL7_9GAMM
MSSVKVIKTLKEQVSHAIDVGDHVRAASILNENLNLFDSFPGFLFKAKVEISVLQHGLDALFDQLKQTPNLQEKYLIEGVLNVSLKRFDDALQLFASALDSNPTDPLLCFFAGYTCMEKGMLSDAIKLFSIPGENMFSESHLLLGRCYAGRGKKDLAYLEFERGFEKLQSDESLLTLLVFMREQIRSDNLLDWGYVQRIRILIEKYKNSLPENRRDLLAIEADIQYITGDTAAAITSFGQLVKEFPEDEESRTSLAYCLLGEGAFKEAYALKPSRIQSYDTLDYVEGLDHLPKWEGQPLDHQRLVVVGEQGLGDRILFSRFLKTLSKKYKPKSVTLIIDERLVPIFNQSDFSKTRVLSIESEIKLNNYDLYCHLSDLLFILGPDSPPTKGLKSYLKADAKKVSYFRDKYKKLFPGKIIVGLTWKSSSKSLGNSKDLVMRELGALLRIPQVQWVALQYGDIQEDLKTIKKEHDCDVFFDQTVDQKHDLESAFAQIESLDYVVTISNATAHICGALGVPATVLVSKRPPWHWLTTGDHSCWYQSLRLIRQSNPNTWYSQLEEIAAYLCHRFKGVTRNSIPTIGEVIALFVTQRHEQLKTQLESISTSELPNSHKSYLAELYLKAGEIKKSTDLVAPLLEIGETSDQNMLLMSKAGRLLGKYQETDALLNLIKSEFYYEEVVLEKLLRALDMEDYSLASKQWEKVLEFSHSIKNLDLLSSFLFQQREWLTLRNYIPQERIDFCFNMVNTFDESFGYRNPVVSIILRAELESYLGNVEAGIKGFKKALSLRPELSHMLNASLGYCLLLSGELKEGFKRHSSVRNVSKDIFSKEAVSYPSIPALEEKDLSDSKVKRILVVCEQGIGDQVLNFQFVRKFQKLFGKDLILTVSPKLVDLTRRTFPGVIHVQSEYEGLDFSLKQTIDRKVYLGNLPLFMLGEFDCYQPETDWLRPHPEKLAYYSKKFREMFPDKKLVGLSWRSASNTWGSSKDVNLTSFLPLMRAENIQCISIQYADVSNEVQLLGADSNLIYLDPEIDITNDLESTIAMIAALDSVVTVSNVNAHFAGAINKPGLVLLKPRSLWHWQHNVLKVPWYPSLEMLREHEYINTDALMRDVLEKV